MQLFVVRGIAGGYHSRHMIKALLLVIEPVAAWERVVAAKRSVVYIVTVFLLPLLLLVCAAEGYGLHHFGKTQDVVAHRKYFSIKESVIYEAGQLVLSILIVFLGAKLLKSLGETFHGRHTFTQSFTAVAYGLSPLFALRVLDMFASVNPWVSWGAGIVLVFAVMYQGVPRVMQPDPPHALGLYLTSVFLLLIVTGLARFVTAWYLEGRFNAVHTVLPGS